MVPIVQLVRMSDCGSEGRGFEPHLAPPKKYHARGDFYRSASYFFNIGTPIFRKTFPLSPNLLSRDDNTVYGCCTFGTVHIFFLLQYFLSKSRKVYFCKYHNLEYVKFRHDNKDEYVNYEKKNIR